MRWCRTRSYWGGSALFKAHSSSTITQRQLGNVVNLSRWACRCSSRARWRLGSDSIALTAAGVDLSGSAMSRTNNTSIMMPSTPQHRTNVNARCGQRLTPDGGTRCPVGAPTQCGYRQVVKKSLSCHLYMWRVGLGLSGEIVKEFRYYRPRR
jgi:hypothetical protein